MKSKLLFFVFALALFLLSNANTLYAQVLTNSFMPARQVTLLYEMPEEIMEEATAEIEKETGKDRLAMSDGLSEKRFAVKLLMRVYSIANLGKIHVKVGSQPGSSDFVKHTFAIEEDTLEAPFTYTRSGKTIILGLGEITGMANYHAEVILENTQGQLSEAMYYGQAE